MSKLVKFEQVRLTESKLRFVCGGTRDTTYAGSGGKSEPDFVDNCGWTAYDDCREKKADGAMKAAVGVNVMASNVVCIMP